mgnify:CR=1 FL=1
MALHIVNHPMVQHKLTLMRKKQTSSRDFRALLREIGMLMGYEVTRNFPLRDIEIETPMQKTVAKEIATRKVVVVPILRAGLGMVEGLLDLMPSARVGHIGMYRDEHTHEPVFYYYRMPGGKDRTVILTDPMLATGGSACDAVRRLKADGYTDIRMMCLVAAPEGVKRLQTEHPDVEIFTAALDNCLNENAYILPGLGDAGDRIFGTKL